MGFKDMRRLQTVVNQYIQTPFEIRFGPGFLCKMAVSLERRSRVPIHFATLLHTNGRRTIENGNASLLSHWL